MAKPEPAFDLNAIIAAIQEHSSAVATGDAGATTAELAAAMGLSHRSVIVMLRRVKAAGRLKIGMALREALSGRPAQVPVYSIIPQEKSTKTKDR